MVLYSLLLALGLIASAPWWLWRMATSGRYREGLGERLGFVPPNLVEVGLRRERIPGVVWIHAVSVGEVLACERLIADLKAKLPPEWRIVVSTTTATGQQMAKTKLKGVRTFYFPLDFAFIVRRYLHSLKPSLFITMESEFWPRMLVECARSGIPVAVVNARVSDRSFPRYMRLRALWKPLLAKVTLFLAQGEESAERLRRIGAPVERVRVSGNLKYDAPALCTNAMTELLRPILKNRKVIVAGSTLADEELMLLKAFSYVRQAEPQVFQAEPNAVLILAPRHPQRFAEVATILESCAAAGAFVSPAIHASKLSNPSVEIQPGSVLLLDTLGDLAAVYQLADVAFVGGSLADAGGHNPLEPARFGVPVLMGPCYDNFREIVNQMIAVDAIRITIHDYLAVAEHLLEGLRDDTEMGLRGKAFYEARAGATERTVEALLGLIGGRT